MSDVLAAHRLALERCTWCPKMCRFSCPTAAVEHRETVTPWFKMTLAGMLRRGKLGSLSEASEVFLHCLGCLHCREHCKHEHDVPSALFAARARCQELGAEAPAVTALLDRFRDVGNPFGEELASGLRAAVAARYFVPEAQALVFAGCQAIRASERHLTPLFALLEALGVDTVGVYHQEELCCAAPLWQAGDRRGFVEHARRLAAGLRGVRQVICVCPTCAFVLGGQYAAEGIRLGPQVVTLDAFLLPLVAATPPRRKLPGGFVYHDPCTLTRYLDRQAAPRELLGAVLSDPLREAHWHGRDATCCGGGGLVPHTLPDVASSAAALRVGQLSTTGAKRVVSACPGCVRQLGEVDGGLPVLDLVEVLLAAYSH